MLSRLNLPVTVATLLVASVCGTGVSHAGQVGERCYPDDPVLRAGQTVGDVQADLVFHPAHLRRWGTGESDDPARPRGLQVLAV